MKRLSLVFALALAIVAFFALHLNDYLTLEGLKRGRDAFEARQVAAPWLFAGAFFALYVAVAALSLPGAAILTLAAGALFGLSTGTFLVSFASAMGATLALFVSRYVFRESVQRRFGAKLKTLNEGMERDGAFYLFTLRLIPVFPFFLVNLLMGLTRVKAGTFYWVSQLGMLPGTLVYVNAGTQLARIGHLSGILSPGLLSSFVLLGIFPWIARAIVRGVRRRRVYARWKRPARYDRNLVVIGAGAAGLVSAYIAATVRARVTLVEANKMGGDCLNYGCVPSKALIRSATVAQQFRDADRYGLQSIAPTISFKAVMARVQAVIRAIEPHDSVERYTSLGVEVLQGHASIIDPWTVEIALNDGGTQRLTTRGIVIASGGTPVVPPLPGIEDSGYVTTDTLWERFAELDAVPPRLVILGGGPIGCELAQCFARLGSKVTQIEKGPRLLTREDPEVSAFARRALERDGVAVLTEHEALRCERAGDRKIIVVASPEAERPIEFDELLCAVGRHARLDGYGLEELGIPTKKTVVTNEYMETLYPNILAAGDVAGPYQFTHMAAHQAWYASVNALFGQLKRFKADYSTVPWTTFLDPEIARVGLSEQDARDRDIAFEVTRFELRELDRAIADSATEGFVKVLTVPGKDRILGVTLVGPHAGDLCAEWVLAMKHGLGLNKVMGTIHTYPTLAEANRYAAGEWKRAHAPQRLLRWVGRYHAWRRGTR
ncbi:MAG: FAD-dependent oxidoreductase [Gammaproteobacteria bacterium]